MAELTIGVVPSSKVMEEWEMHFHNRREKQEEVYTGTYGIISMEYAAQLTDQPSIYFPIEIAFASFKFDDESAAAMPVVYHAFTDPQLPIGFGGLAKERTDSRHKIPYTMVGLSPTTFEEVMCKLSEFVATLSNFGGSAPIIYVRDDQLDVVKGCFKWMLKTLKCGAKTAPFRLSTIDNLVAAVRQFALNDAQFHRQEVLKTLRKIDYHWLTCSCCSYHKGLDLDFCAQVSILHCCHQAMVEVGFTWLKDAVKQGKVVVNQAPVALQPKKPASSVDTVPLPEEYAPFACHPAVKVSQRRAPGQDPLIRPLELENSVASSVEKDKENSPAGIALCASALVPASVPEQPPAIIPKPRQPTVDELLSLPEGVDPVIDRTANLVLEISPLRPTVARPQHKPTMMLPFQEGSSNWASSSAPKTLPKPENAQSEFGRGNLFISSFSPPQMANDAQKCAQSSETEKKMPTSQPVMSDLQSTAPSIDVQLPTSSDLAKDTVPPPEPKLKVPFGKGIQRSIPKSAL